MKTLIHSTLLMVLFTSILGSSSAFAEKMNPETQDLVISKMERVISMMKPSDSSWNPSQQRLADLLAERARYRFMLEIEANCEGCKGSKADRDKAVAIYEDLLKTRALRNDGLILFQLAHLYQMAGKVDKSQQLFESVLKTSKTKKVSQSILTRTRVGLGDLLFQKGQFKETLVHYTAALNDKNLENRALVIYNRSWAEFNLEQIQKSISTLLSLLSNPNLIVRDKEDGPVYDAAFHADIVKDLATFYARKSVTESDINQYEALIPKGHRKALLMHFAEEVDRVGQKKAALIILNKYLQDKTLNDEERLHAYVMKAQVGYDHGNSAQSTQDFAKAAKAFQDEGCDDKVKCERIQKTMKRYVTELHRSKKLKPDADLLSAYTIYGKTFTNDKEMYQRGARTAVEIGQYAAAIGFYRSISKGEFDKKDKEQALVDEVATAESSNDPALKKDSYVFFINNSDNKEKVFEVRYQLAYLSYQQKQYKEAAEAFYDLAKTKGGKADLRKKSADLSLDSLAILKDDAKLEMWAWEYGRVFPKASLEFETLARKALMNQVALVANNKESSTSDLRSYLNRTWAAKLTGATNQEKILFFNNASVLATRIGDDERYLKAQQALLNQSGVSEAQKQQIFKDLASFYEKRLDFKQAYNWSKKIKDAKLSEKERQFRLGTLADLAQINPSSHYKAALKAGLKDGRSYIIRSRLIALSSNPVAELKRQAPEMKRQPQILNDMVLFVYAKTGNKKALTSLVQMRELRNRSAAKFLLSQALYEKIEQHRRKISSSKFSSYSTRALQKGTATRVKLLSQADSLLKESLQLKDITAQMMVLDIISTENTRLAADLGKVPAPKGLNQAQMAQYTSLLQSQLQPFTMKAQLAEQKKQEVWAQSPQLAQLIAEYKIARPEMQRLMNRPLQLLSKVSGDGKLKSNLEDALSSSQVSMKDLASARQSVSENPNDAREIENLKNLEHKIGHPLMPAYLEARLNHLQKEKKL